MRTGCAAGLRKAAWRPSFQAAPRVTAPTRLTGKACRRRNVVGRMFGGLKNQRRVATRNDRLAAIAPVATLTQWLE